MEAVMVLTLGTDWDNSETASEVWNTRVAQSLVKGCG